MTSFDPSRIPTLTQLLRERAEASPDAMAVRFFEGGEREGQTFSYAELDTAARALSVTLRDRVSPGDRVLLMFPPGLDFVVAFWACIYSGAVAVPAYPPEMHRLEHAIRRLQAVIDDAKPKVVVTTPEILAMAGPLASALPQAKRLFEIPWVSSEHDPSAASSWAMPAIDGPSLAFLQYTSGSTGNPKGAMLAHQNLLGDLVMLRDCLARDDYAALHTVCWVPLYHDLGLIGHLLMAIYTGGTCNVMSPIDFLKKPIRWLKLLAATKARLSGAPNFGFELCLRKVTPDEVSTLDLSHVEHIANCAEPIRASTLKRFYERFAPAGLKMSAFAPCYGLAEATVMVTCTSAPNRPTFLHVDKAALEEHRVVISAPATEATVTLVGCGRPWRDAEVVIAAMSGDERAEQGQIGEIWTRGANVAAGYWGRPEVTQEVFGGKLAGDERPYLRTGDLGFVHEGELYVTGRLKDLIIVRGRNLYPQDVERAVDELRADIPQVRVGCSAAFAWTASDSEELVFVQEVSSEPGDGFDAKLCVSEMRRVIFEGFEVQPFEIVLLKSGSIPKTSSGKIMRSACRAAYGEHFKGGALEPLYREREGEPQPVAAPAVEVNDSAPVSIMAPSSHWKPASFTTPASHAAPSPHTRKHADEMIEWVREWAPQRFDPRLADERRSVAPHVILELGESGILGMRVPPRWGGAGVSILDATRIMQQLSAIDFTLAAIVGVNSALGIHPIVGFAHADLRDEVLPDLGSGRKLAAFALTERQAGSNPLAIESRALGGGPWSLYGEKIWVGLGSWAGVVNVFVQEEGGTEGVLGFALPQPRRGMTMGPEAMTMGVRSMVQSSIVLNGVSATEREMLGAAGKGFDVAVSAMTEGRLLIAAAAVGGMKRALQLMARYAERRAIGTGLLLDNPVTRERMAEATFGTLALDALVTRLATLRDSKAAVPSEVYSAVKVAGSELLWTTVDQLVQLLGGRGYMEQNDASRLLRDARLLRIFEGPTETLSAHLGSSVLRSADRWKTVFASSLRAPRIGIKVVRAAEELKATLTDRRDVAARRLVEHRAGMVLCWALLAAALESGGGRGGVWTRASAWLASRFETALDEARDGVADAKGLVGKDELRDILGRFEVQIADVEIPGQGEDWKVDGYLQKTFVKPQSQAMGATVIEVEVARPRAPSKPPAPPVAKEVSPAEAKKARAAMTTTLVSELIIPPEWRTDDDDDDDAPVAAKAPPVAAPKAAREPSESRSDPIEQRRREVETWLVDWVTRTLGTPEGGVDIDEPLTTYGVDSLAVVEITSDIEARFALEVPESIFWNHRTVRAMSTYIAKRLGEPTQK